MKMSIKSQFLFFVFAAFFMFMVLSPDFVSAVPPKSNLLPSDYDTGISWQQAVKDNKPIAVNFYVDWCGYCKKFAPILDRMRQQYQSKYNFVLVNAENPKNRKLVNNFGIEGYPSFYLVSTKTHVQKKINSAYYADPGALRRELDQFIIDNQ